jgi:hypothetical protein
MGRMEQLAGLPWALFLFAIRGKKRSRIAGFAKERQKLWRR